VCHVFLAMKTISIRTPSALARGIPLASSTYGGPPLVDRVRPVAANTEDQFRQQTRAPPPKGSCRCPSRRTTNDIPPSVSATPAAWPPPSPAPSTPPPTRGPTEGPARRKRQPLRSMPPFRRSPSLGSAPQHIRRRRRRAVLGRVRPWSWHSGWELGFSIFTRGRKEKKKG
jgi:hypothetical protein